MPKACPYDLLKTLSGRNVDFHAPHFRLGPTKRGQNGDEMETIIKKKNPRYLNFKYLGFSQVSEMRLELTRSNDHYPLKVARLPIPPSGHFYRFA